MKKNRGLEIPLPGTLRYDGSGGFLWHGEQSGVMVADTGSKEGLRVRGWGYLTGTGGLNLSDEEAAAYQDRVGRRMEQCWNLCSVLGLTDEELEVLLSARREVLRAALQTSF